MGGITHHLVPQTELAEMAHPFYNQFARGGEGHLEVGKNVYYTVHKLCHMVLALKPFGCMPSSQSDGVQSAVINKFKDMIFLPIETSGEGEVNAHSRVQMALGEAKVKAKTEFEQCLKSTGKSLDEIREFISEHPELRRPFYHVPHREGVAGTGAGAVPVNVNGKEGPALGGSAKAAEDGYKEMKGLLDKALVGEAKAGLELTDDLHHRLGDPGAQARGGDDQRDAGTAERCESAGL
jgi:hypothetical protein